MLKILYFLIYLLRFVPRKNYKLINFEIRKLINKIWYYINKNYILLMRDMEIFKKFNINNTVDSLYIKKMAVKISGVI